MIVSACCDGNSNIMRMGLLRSQCISFDNLFSNVDVDCWCIMSILFIERRTLHNILCLEKPSLYFCNTSNLVQNRFLQCSDERALVDLNSLHG